MKSYYILVIQVKKKSGHDYIHDTSCTAAAHQTLIHTHVSFLCDGISTWTAYYSCCYYYYPAEEYL